MRFHVLNTSRSPHTEEKRATCPEAIGLVFRLRGQPIYHRTARWMSVDDLVNDIERVCFGVRYGIIEVRFNDPSGDPLEEEALRGVVSKVGELKSKVVKGKAEDISPAFDHLSQKQKKVPVKPKAKKEEPKPPPKPAPKPEPEPKPEPPEVDESKSEEGKGKLDDLKAPTEKEEPKKAASKKKKKRATSKKSD